MQCVCEGLWCLGEGARGASCYTWPAVHKVCAHHGVFLPVHICLLRAVAVGLHESAKVVETQVVQSLEECMVGARRDNEIACEGFAMPSCTLCTLV